MTRPVTSAPVPGTPGTSRRPPGEVPRRRTVNITPAERAGRIAIGVSAAIAGIVLLIGAASAVAVVLELLLVLVGLDLFITGVLGHCPLYAKLGHVPRAPRSPR